MIASLCFVQGSVRGAAPGTRTTNPVHDVHNSSPPPLVATDNRHSPVCLAQAVDRGSNWRHWDWTLLPPSRAYRYVQPHARTRVRDQKFLPLGPLGKMLATWVSSASFRFAIFFFTCPDPPSGRGGKRGWRTTWPEDRQVKNLESSNSYIDCRVR